MELNALKCTQIHIPQKGPKNATKCQKITNNCKISEITKYGEKMTKMPNNVKTMPKTGQKRPKNGKISNICVSSFFWLETTSKMVLAVSTRCLVPEIHMFGHFGLKSAFVGLNSSRTKEITAKPMVLIM